MITRRDLFKKIWLAPAALLALPKEVKAKRDKKKKRKRKVLKATIPSMSGMAAGSYVIPNTRTVTTNFTLEYDNGGYTTIAADQYRVAPFSGYVVKRSTDDSDASVDWSTYLDYPMYWTGTIISTGGQYTVTRELIEFVEVPLVNPVDIDGAIQGELVYDLFLSLYADSGLFLFNDNNSYLSFGPAGPLDALTAATAQLHAEGSIIYLDGIGRDETATGIVKATAYAQSGTKGYSIILVAQDGTNNYGYAVIGGNGDITYPFTGLYVGNNAENVSSPTAMLDVDSDKMRLRTAKTPSSAADTGNAGDICWDSSYLYVCTATNTWKRVAIATW